jgi:heme-degrading monooxygenase HmoA
MYAVIFKSKIKQIDDDYTKTAQRMRDLAIHEYGCAEFVSVTEGVDEISISYWKCLEDITLWKKNIEHLKAQALGQSKWYDSYKIEVVEVLREYESKNW